MQAGVDTGGKALQVAFGPVDRRCGGRAAAVARFRGGFDRLEVGQQRTGVFRGDQACAGAPAGDEHGGEHAERGGEQQANRCTHHH